MIKHLLALITGLGLAACGNSSSPPPPLPPPPAAALPHSFGPSAGWAVTQGSQQRGLNNGAFDFQQCASALTCWDSYVEVLWSADISGVKSVTFKYEITGNNPVWVNDSKGNTCGGAAALSLLLHRSGDQSLMTPTYRLFSSAAHMQILAVGKNIFSVPVDQSNWANVYGEANFGDTLYNIGSVGFTLGGGCFAGHGVAVSSGSAKFQIIDYEIQ
jgi:hypothetical protein